MTEPFIILFCSYYSSASFSWRLFIGIMLLTSKYFCLICYKRLTLFFYLTFYMLTWIQEHCPVISFFHIWLISSFQSVLESGNFPILKLQKNLTYSSHFSDYVFWIFWGGNPFQSSLALSLPLPFSSVCCWWYFCLYDPNSYKASNLGHSLAVSAGDGWMS